jgi:hypothetical protein
MSQAAVLADGVARGIFQLAARELAREYSRALPLRDRAALHRRRAGLRGLRSSIRPEIRAIFLGLLLLHHHDALSLGRRHGDAPDSFTTFGGVLSSPGACRTRRAHRAHRTHLRLRLRLILGQHDYLQLLLLLFETSRLLRLHLHLHLLHHLHHLHHHHLLHL